MAKKLKYKIKIIAEASVGRAADAAIRKLLAACFPKDAAIFSKSRNWHSAPEYILVARQGQAVIGHVAIVRRKIACGRTKIAIAGIQSLAVHPRARGAGLAQALMTESMAEAWRRKIEFGLLFCVPELERFYAALGWRRIDGPFSMRDEAGARAEIPRKNIGMILLLSNRPFPSGAVDLQGRDW